MRSKDKRKKSKSLGDEILDMHIRSNIMASASSIPTPVNGGYEDNDNSRVKGSGIACHADEGFDDLGYDIP